MKFVDSRGKLISKVQDLIHSSKKRRNSENFAEVFQIDQLTQCPRRILYRAYGTQSDNQSENKELCDSKLLNHDYYVRHKWADWFKQQKGYFTVILTNPQTVVADGRFNMQGHVDFVARFNELVFATKIFCVDLPISENPPRSHIVDMMVCCNILESSLGLLIYETRHDQSYQLFEVYPDRAVINSVHKLCLDLMAHQLHRTLFHRPYTSSDSKECTSCEFKGECWDPHK